MSRLISEEALSYLLTAAAEDLPVPEGGAERVLAGGASPGRRRRAHPALLAAAAVVVLAGAAAGVALSGGVGGGHGTMAASSAPERGAPGSYSGAAVAAPAPAAKGAGNGPASAQQPNPARPAVTPRVIKTGQVALQVPAARVGATVSKADAAAGGLGGYVQDSSSQQAGSYPSATLTLRVPAARFDALVAAVRGLGKVTVVQESGQDVTGQYVDLSARISALEASRATYLSILGRASTIGNVLAVQQQIDSVQQQIDELKGQQQVLASESGFGTLTVSVTTPGAPAAASPSGLRRAFDASVHGFVVGFEDLLAALGPLLLALICLAALVALARLAWRLGRRRLV